MWSRNIARYLAKVAAPLNGLELVAGLLIVGGEAGLSQTEPRLLMVLRWLDWFVLCAFALRLFVRVLHEPTLARRPVWVLPVVTVGALCLFSIRIAAGLALVLDGLRAVRRVLELANSGEVIKSVGERPARSLVLSFAGLIVLGTLVLALPASQSGPRIPILDAFFTSVSATCVTGLVTIDTATAWTPFGQGVIFALFQLGGLGIMVLSGAVSLAFGEALGARRGEALRSVFDEADAEELKGLLRTVVYGTFFIEGLGAVMLFFRFWPDMEPVQALSHAVFHAVSAFCNAGFSLNSDSLVAYADDVVVNGVVVALLTLGGLGFGVLVGLWRVMTRGQRLNVHAAVVLTTSAALLWCGALVYFFCEYDRTLAHLSLGSKLLASFFQSASTRTAGFNSVSFESLHPLTLMAMITLMLIGASPGSTGGGMKTTTFALILLAARAILTEREDVHAFGRRVSNTQVLRAVGLVGGGLVSLALGFGLLLLTETLPFEKLAFEAASALGTVGLSLGATSELSTPGRVVVCVLMFVGRVGPLTAFAALASRARRAAPISLPEGKVLVG